MIGSTRKLIVTCFVAALAVSAYGCSSSTEDRLRAERDEANMAAAEAALAVEMAEQRATEAEAARMMAEQARMEADAARAEADRLRTEAEEAARMADEDAAAAMQRATDAEAAAIAAEQRAFDAEADAAAARESLRLAQEDLMTARAELDAVTMAATMREQANEIDWVANNSRSTATEMYIGNWWWSRSLYGITGHTLSQTHKYGETLHAILSHDENGDIVYNVSLWENEGSLQETPLAWARQYIRTDEDPQVLQDKGFHSTTEPVDHPFDPQTWTMTKLSTDYESGGTLTVHIATDLQRSDMATDPFGKPAEYGHEIFLNEAPEELPPSRDYLVVWLNDGETTQGSLDGVAGTFSCDNDMEGGCAFADDHVTTSYYVFNEGVSFTPTGGTQQSVAALPRGTDKATDYMTFGYWQNVPQNVSNSDAHGFGVFASGGDPYEPTNLTGLIGTASYSGHAVGMYYTDELSSSPSTGSFTADVALNADFGSGSESGFVSGEIDGFDFGAGSEDVNALFPDSVVLTTTAYGSFFGPGGYSGPDGLELPANSTNIFAGAHLQSGFVYPGGLIQGFAEAMVDGDYWGGAWYGTFFGNGASSTEHPTGIGGTFGTYVWNDNGQSDGGLAGSFAAQRQ